jgi:hypothetical protein
VNSDGSFKTIFYPSTHQITVTQSGKVIDYQLTGNSAQQVTKNHKGLLESIGKLVLSYDYNGRLQKIGNLPITYNFNNNIVAIGNTPILYNYNRTVFAIGDQKISYDDKGKSLSDAEVVASAAIN